jgi:chromate transporter
MVSLPQLSWVFLKIGALGFGGPFSLLAIMQKEVVERRRWLTPQEFTESVAIGTVTPGPIFFAAAVFVGYRLRGLRGATSAAVAVLLPGFLLAVIIAALYGQVQQSPWVAAGARGLAAGVVGLFISVVWRTGRTTVTSVAALATVVAAFLALAILHLDPLLLIVLAGLAGALLSRSVPSGQAGGK